MHNQKREEKRSENEGPLSKKMKLSSSEDLLLSLAPFNKITSKIFQHLSLQELSRLCVTSKYMSTYLFDFMMTESFTERIVLSMMNVSENGTMLKLQCHRVALLAKRSSWLFSMKIRMQFFFLLTQKIQMRIQHHRPNVFNDLILDCIGIMLHVFVAGWEDSECEKICSFLIEKLKIRSKMNIFLSDEVGSNADNEKYLRMHIRHIFLDHCTRCPTKALWLYYFTYVYNTDELSRVILLLYGPIGLEGKIHWSFAAEPRSFERYTNTYVLLANVLRLLKFMPNWTQNHSLEVLIYMSNVPTCWLLRSFASIVIPLISGDMELVSRYLFILYDTDRTNIASLLIALAMTVTPYFTNNTTTALNNGLEITSNNVKRLVFSVLKSDHIERRSDMVSSLWDTISKLAFDFADATRELDELDDIDVRYDFSQDFHDLIRSWKDFIVEAIKEN